MVFIMTLCKHWLPPPTRFWPTVPPKKKTPSNGYVPPTIAAVVRYTTWPLALIYFKAILMAVDMTKALRPRVKHTWGRSLSVSKKKLPPLTTFEGGCGRRWASSWRATWRCSCRRFPWWRKWDGRVNLCTIFLGLYSPDPVYYGPHAPFLNGSP